MQLLFAAPLDAAPHPADARLALCLAAWLPGCLALCLALCLAAAAAAAATPTSATTLASLLPIQLLHTGTIGCLSSPCDHVLAQTGRAIYRLAHEYAARQAAAEAGAAESEGDSAAAKKKKSADPPAIGCALLHCPPLAAGCCL